MTEGSDGIQFEQWLEDHLQRALSARPGPSPLATQASYHAASLTGGTMSLTSSIVTALTSKAAVGVTAAVLVVGGGTAAAGIAATGSANPGDWNMGVSQAVQNCKDRLASGEHGIGQCVASYARHHGASAAATNPGHTGDHGKASEAHQNPKPGKPADAGKPTDAGKPANPGDSGSASGQSGSAPGGAPSHPGNSKH
jgi:hypothetical protein